MFNRNNIWEIKLEENNNNNDTISCSDDSDLNLVAYQNLVSVNHRHLGLIQKNNDPKQDEQEPQIKKKVKLEEFKDIQCIVHMDNICLIEDLLKNGNIYQCQKNLHQCQYLCLESKQKINKCPLCKARDIKKIDILHKTILKDEFMVCKNCSVRITPENATEHLLEDVYKKAFIFKKDSVKTFKKYKEFIKSISDEFEHLLEFKLKDLVESVKKKLKQFSHEDLVFIALPVQDQKSLTQDKNFHKQLQINGNLDEKQGFQLILFKYALIFTVLENQKNENYIHNLMPSYGLF